MARLDYCFQNKPYAVIANFLHKKRYLQSTAEWQKKLPSTWTKLLFYIDKLALNSPLNWPIVPCVDFANTSLLYNHRHKIAYNKYLRAINFKVSQGISGWNQRRIWFWTSMKIPAFPDHPQYKVLRRSFTRFFISQSTRQKRFIEKKNLNPGAKD